MAARKLKILPNIACRFPSISICAETIKYMAQGSWHMMNTSTTAISVTVTRFSCDTEVVWDLRWNCITLQDCSVLNDFITLTLGLRMLLAFVISPRTVFDLRTIIIRKLLKVTSTQSGIKMNTNSVTKYQILIYCSLSPSSVEVVQ